SGVHRRLPVAQEFAAEDIEHQIVPTRPTAVDGGLRRLCLGGNSIDGESFEAAVDQQLHHGRADGFFARPPATARRLGPLGHHHAGHRRLLTYVYETVQYTS